MVINDWMAFERAPQHLKQNTIEGAGNRLRKFLRNEVIRLMVGQKERVLDFPRIMEEGKILLVNLSGAGRISPENTKLLGILLVNEIFRAAKLRDPLDPDLKPFYFYIDEFAQFVTRDIARALEECRKYNLFLILAHQHLAQLKKEDPYLYASVMTNCRNKIVFGGLSVEDAEEMTAEIMTGFLDLKAIKDEMYTTKVRHIEETRTVRGRSWGLTVGQNDSETLGISEGITETQGSADNWGTSQSDTTGQSETSGTHESRGRSLTDGSTQGRGDSAGITNGITDGASATEGKGHTHTRNRSDTAGMSTT